jgi:hypothetical protein
MTKWLLDVPELDGMLDLLQLDGVAVSRELLTVMALLHEARDVVRAHAGAKCIDIVVVGVADEVFVNRAPVVSVVAALLRHAIDTVPSGGRVAVTAQEFERELVFAVYDSGKPCAPSSRFDYSAAEAAYALGGRIWSARQTDGNLSLFSLPLYRDQN